MAVVEEHGFVGNVWVRQNWLIKAGDTAGGHAHYHDHVSLLVKGSVEISVDDNAPKQFHAPTYIVIKKNHRHNIVALEDGTVFYCVFAMRDIDGNVVDIYQDANVPDYGEDSPEYTKVAPDDYWEIPA
jgi:quercetin dioxygenase-like cupin family protein